jgi:o-succinylbenzoate synthase
VTPQVRLHEHELALRRPLPTAHGTITARQLVEVHIAVGPHIGIGEAAPLPGFGMESYAEAKTALASWSVDRQPPTGRAATGAVMTAVEQLEAARDDLSLAELLVGEAVEELPVAVQALVGASDPAEAANAAAAAATAGHLGVKLKVGTLDPEIDIARIIAIRAIAPDLILRLDANGGWSFNAAREVLAAVADLNIDLVEEPTQDPTQFAALANTTGARIGLDEHAVSASAIRELVAAGGIDALVLKPAVLGGPRATYDIGRIGQSLGCRAIVTSFIDGTTSLRAATQIARALSPAEIHGLGTASLFAESLPDDVSPSGGYLR